MPAKNATVAHVAHLSDLASPKLTDYTVTERRGFFVYRTERKGLLPLKKTSGS